MKIKLNPSEYADVLIEPKLSLVETSKVLSALFDGLPFDEDDGYYEEYPAFVANDRQAGIHFALLGIPDEKYEIRENPSKSYALTIEPIEPLEDAFTLNISASVAALINEDGRLKAHVPGPQP